MIESFCRPNAIDSCRPVWDVIVVQPSPVEIVVSVAMIVGFMTLALVFLSMAALLIADSLQRRA